MKKLTILILAFFLVGSVIAGTILTSRDITLSRERKAEAGLLNFTSYNITSPTNTEVGKYCVVPNKGLPVSCKYFNTSVEGEAWADRRVEYFLDKSIAYRSKPDRDSTEVRIR